MNKICMLAILIACIWSSHMEAQSDSRRDFDFWLGEWNVYIFGTDSLVGYSEIKTILGHTAIEENYKNIQSNYRGSSYNLYNRVTQQWEQHWIDNTGYSLFLKGGIENGKMVMSHLNASNHDKIIWSPLKDGSVRQEWMQSHDNGKTWTRAFDGHYKPMFKNKTYIPVLPHLAGYPNNRDFTISNNGEEAYLTVQNPTEETRMICRLTKINEVWSEPIPTSFSGTHKDIEPYFSPDNLRLYFSSDRPNDTENPDYDIYYVERTHIDSAWSIPINVGKPINSPGDEFYPAITSSGNLYFTAVLEQTKGRDDIYFSKFKEGKYSLPTSLDTTINSQGYEFNAYVAPDESYLIFSGYNRTDGQGSGDLYISKKNKNGHWSDAINLTEINSKYMDYCPFVVNDTIYFTSRRNARIPEKIKDNFEIEKIILRYENGDSKIYKSFFSIDDY